MNTEIRYQPKNKPASYDVSHERNYDGVYNWVWTLWIDDYAWDSYYSESEAWAEAERLEAISCQDNLADVPERSWSDPEASELAVEDETSRAETWAQTQDRERNQ